MKVKSWTQYIGIIGTPLYVYLLLRHPSFPTPDKILILLTLISAIFGQAKELLKRFLPFVLLLVAYESFRGIADDLNKHVEFTWMIHADKFLFGGELPTHFLQRHFWHGHTQWYDFGFYITYMLHFVLPFALAVVIWKKRDAYYWRYIATYIFVSFMGFITFIVFPAAPPWMAADQGYIQQFAHIGAEVWGSLGLTNFPTVYSKISPNPVAAVPSLHAAYGTLLVLFSWRLFGKKWGVVAAIYPLIIYVGTVYAGEHYAIDEIIGIAYAITAYFAVRALLRNKKLMRNLHDTIHKLQSKFIKTA